MGDHIGEEVETQSINNPKRDTIRQETVQRTTTRIDGAQRKSSVARNTQSQTEQIRNQTQLVKSDLSRKNG